MKLREVLEKLKMTGWIEGKGTSHRGGKPNRLQGAYFKSSIKRYFHRYA